MPPMFWKLMLLVGGYTVWFLTHKKREDVDK